MPIEFRNLKDNATINQSKSSGLSTQLWLPPASKRQAEETLFYYLSSVCENRPQVAAPLLLAKDTLHTLYSHPHPDLLEALRRCLNQFLVELTPNAARWGRLDIPTAILGVALATYNCICLSPSLAMPGTKDVAEDPITHYGFALIDTLPRARTLPDMLAYHALLRHIPDAIPALDRKSTRLNSSHS